jgi:tRNA(Ile)-lysidine synthase
VSAPPPAAADPDRSLDRAEFAARLDALGPFERAPELAVAVSGGPDSMALVLLAQGWAAARGGRVAPLIVDHRLRPESAAEAARVAGWLEHRGIAAQVLAWEGAKPATGIQAAARQARYRLLADACHDAGILHLLLGHQCQDQAETVAMRAASGSGPGGLAGMPVVAEHRGLRLLRPLLGVPRSRLVATLRAAGQPWIDDPSNVSPRFRRATLRQDLTLDVGGLWREASLQAAARAERERAAAAFLAAHARPHPLGFVRLEHVAWAALPADTREDLLRRLLAAVGGRAYPPSVAAVRRLAARLTEAPARCRLTLGGCVVSLRRAELVVTREPGRVTERVMLSPGGAHLWDARFVIAYAAGPGPLEVARLGEVGRRALPVRVAAGLRAAGVPVAAVAALPAFWDGARLVGCAPLARYACASPDGFVAQVTPRVALPLAGAPFAGTNVVSNP